MLYNISEIGSIINRERQNAGDTLEEFSEKIGVARQTLSRWENGKGNAITLDVLLKICEVVDCDFGYIVGEYPYKKRVTSDLGIETGLSEEAISRLRELQYYPCSFAFIDAILKSPPDLLEKIAKKQIAYTHVKNSLSPVIEKYKDELDGNSIVADIQINGEKLPLVPIQDLNTYALFDLWLAFSEFINSLV